MCIEVAMTQRPTSSTVLTVGDNWHLALALLGIANAQSCDSHLHLNTQVKSRYKIHQQDTIIHDINDVVGTPPPFLPSQLHIGCSPPIPVDICSNSNTNSNQQSLLRANTIVLACWLEHILTIPAHKFSMVLTTYS
jgi:hypothetical protein